MVRLTFDGANPNPTIEGLTPLPGGVNFFLGNDPAQWQHNLPTYEGIVYRELYPGIDLVYRGVDGRLKSEFVVAPDTNPGQIRLRYEGAESLSLRDDGALVIQTAGGELVEAPLLIYQEINGIRREIEGRYVIQQEENSQLAPIYPSPTSKIQNPKSKIVAVQVVAYDPTLPLIIDPELVFSSYLGGSSTSIGSGINVDDAGNIYVAASTYWGPETSVVLINQLINAGGVYTFGYSTYVGGGFGSHTVVHDLDFDNSGNIYAAGLTSLNGNNSSQNAFVTQLVRSGQSYTPGYSFSLGGSNSDYASNLAVDNVGNAYVIGTTSSTDFSTRNAVQATYGGGYSDAFVTQIVSASGVYTYGFSTYLGGNDREFGSGIAVDEVGNIYIGGSTNSSNFPTWQPLQGDQPGEDAFVTQIISVSGVYTYGFSTYLGSSSSEAGYEIAVDSADNIYLNGTVLVSSFPSFIRDVFVRQLIRSGGVYTYGYLAYLGGNGDDYSFNMALDDAGNVYVAGTTYSTNFPIHNAIQDTFGGALDTFVTKIITTNGVLTYGFSTYLGGSDFDPNYGLAVDSAGNAYVTGSTASTDFPMVNPIQGTYGGGSESAYVAKIGSSLPTLTLTKSVTPTMAVPGQRLTYTVVISNSGIVSATNAVISDTLPAGLTFAGPVSLNPPGAGAIGTPPTLVSSLTITAGQAITVTFPVTVNLELSGGTRITNTAAVTSAEIATPIMGTAVITIAEVPAITITKTANVSTVQIGQTITYAYHVTNTGNVTLTGLNPSDDRLGQVTLSQATLAPNQSTTGTLAYTVIADDLPSPLTNTVTVTGASPSGPVVTATDIESVALSSNPAITVTKSANVSTVQVGESITYTYRVTNTGNITLTNVSASDDKLGQVTLGSTTLAPNEDAAGLLTYTIAQADLPGPLTNTVVVTGTPPGGPAVTATTSVSVTLIPQDTDSDSPLYLPLIVKNN